MLMNTAAQLVRNLFTRSIELGRRYAQSGNQKDLYEAFRLMGTGLHCLEGMRLISECYVFRLMGIL
jgi:hypothetical protein